MKNPMFKEKEFLNECVNNYEDPISYFGYNLGAEARRKAQAEKIRLEAEKKASIKEQISVKKKYYYVKKAA